MDKALLELLEEKDFEYITVKEICQKAGVNRSTFYLHYETIGDLLSECIDYMNQVFYSYFPPRDNKFSEKTDLYFITPEYLNPYLQYIKENKRIFQTSINKSAILNSNKKYDALFNHIFSPIMEKYNIPENKRKYVITFYINGIIAVICQWLKNDCAESIEFIVNIITDNIGKPKD